MRLAPPVQERVGEGQERQPPVDHHVVHEQVGGAVGRDADPDRHQERWRAGRVDADGQDQDRDRGEHDGEEVVRLEGTPGRLVVTPMPSHPEAVHHEPMDQSGDRLHQHERRHGDQHVGHDRIPLAGEGTAASVATTSATSRDLGAVASHNSIASVSSAKP